MVAEGVDAAGSLALAATPDSTLSSIYEKLKQEQARQKSRLASISSTSFNDSQLHKDSTKETQNSQTDAVRQLRLQKASDLEALLAKARSRAERLLQPEHEAKCSWEFGSENSIGSMLEELERQIDVIADDPCVEPETLAAANKLEQRLEMAERTMELLRSEGALAHAEKKIALAEVVSLEARLEEKDVAIADKDAIVEALEKQLRAVQSDMALSEEEKLQALAIAEDEKQQQKDKLQQIEEELTFQKEIATKATKLSETQELSVKELNDQVDQLRKEAAEEKARSHNAAVASAEELKLLGEIISQSGLKEETMQKSVQRLQEQLEANERRVVQMQCESEQKTVEIRNLSVQLEDKDSFIQQLQTEVKMLSQAPPISPFSSLQQAALEAKVKSEVEERFSHQVKALENLVTDLQKQNDTLRQHHCDRPRLFDTNFQTDSDIKELENELDILNSEVESSKTAMQLSAQSLAEAKTTKEALRTKLAAVESITHSKAPAKRSRLASIEASIMIQRKKATFLIASGQSPGGIKECHDKLQALEEELALAKERSSNSAFVSQQDSQCEMEAGFALNGENQSTVDELKSALDVTDRTVSALEQEIIVRNQRWAELAAKAVQLSSRSIEALTKKCRDSGDDSGSSPNSSTSLRAELAEKERNIPALQKQNENLRIEMECQTERLKTNIVEFEILQEQSEQARLMIALRDDDLQAKARRIKELTDEVEQAQASQQTSIQASDEKTDRDEPDVNSGRLIANGAILRELDQARKELLEATNVSAVIDSLKQEVTEKAECITAYQEKAITYERSIDDLQNEKRKLEIVNEDILRKLDEARIELLEATKVSAVIDSLKQEVTEKDDCITAYAEKTITLESSIDDLQNETRKLEIANVDILRELDETRRELLEATKVSADIDSLKQEAMEKDEFIAAYAEKTIHLESSINDLQNETRKLKSMIDHCKKMILEIEQELEVAIKASKEFEERAREVDALRSTVSSQNDILRKYKEDVSAFEAKLALARDQGNSDDTSLGNQVKSAGYGKKHLHRIIAYALALSLALVLAFLGMKNDTTTSFRDLQRGKIEIEDRKSIPLVKKTTKLGNHMAVPTFLSTDPGVTVHNRKVRRTEMTEELGDETPVFIVRPEAAKIASNVYRTVLETSPSVTYESAKGPVNVDKFRFMKGLRTLAVKTLELSRNVAAHIDAHSYQKHIEETSFDGLDHVGNGIKSFMVDELLNPEKIRLALHDAAYAHAFADGLDPSSLLLPPSVPWRELTSSLVHGATKLHADMGSSPMAGTMWDAYLFEYPSVHHPSYKDNPTLLLYHQRKNVTMNNNRALVYHNNNKNNTVATTAIIC